MRMVAENNFFFCVFSTETTLWEYFELRMTRLRLSPPVHTPHLDSNRIWSRECERCTESIPLFILFLKGEFSSQWFQLFAQQETFIREDDHLECDRCDRSAHSHYRGTISSDDKRHRWVTNSIGWDVRINQLMTSKSNDHVNSLYRMRKIQCRATDTGRIESDVYWRDAVDGRHWTLHTH